MVPGTAPLWIGLPALRTAGYAREYPMRQIESAETGICTRSKVHAVFGWARGQEN
jgi:hypothetical protein